MKMDVSGQQLSTSQTLKLPIPRLTTTTSLLTPNTKFPDILIPNNNNWTSTPQFPINLPSTQVTTQPMLTTSTSMSKPTPNKRGRKPLSKMPETKKHIQNLTNQRAFRRRREDYVRTLESKAATYETLYIEAQNDVKMLRDRLNMLERRLAKAQGNHNEKPCNTSLYQENDTSIDVIMSNGTFDGNRLSAITPTTISSFSFNYQQKPCSPTNSTTKSVESVEDIINNPVFCETKEGDLCFCESVEDNTEKEQLPPTDSRCYIDQKDGKRMWIIPKRSIQYSCNDSSQTRECCPTLPLPEQSQWSSQQRQENYFSPSPSPIEPSPPNYIQHHKLNLRLILGDRNDESSDDSA